MGKMEKSFHFIKRIKFAFNQKKTPFGLFKKSLFFFQKDTGLFIKRYESF